MLVVEERAANAAPVADAGPDLTFSGSATCWTDSYGNQTCPDCPALGVAVDGSGSFDPDGDALEWSWSALTGNPTLGGADTPVATIIMGPAPSVAGLTVTLTYELQLEVSDCPGLSDADTVLVHYACEGIE